MLTEINLIPVLVSVHICVCMRFVCEHRVNLYENINVIIRMIYTYESEHKYGAA